MWGEVISSKEKRIFYLSPILLFMSFMAYPPQILSVSFFSQVACLWTQQWERKRKDEEVKEQMEGEGVPSLAARKAINLSDVSVCLVLSVVVLVSKWGNLYDPGCGTGGGGCCIAYWLIASQTNQPCIACKRRAIFMNSLTPSSVYRCLFLLHRAHNKLKSWCRFLAMCGQLRIYCCLSDMLCTTYIQWVLGSC